MAFAGLRGTGDWATDERPKNFREAILWRQPNGMTPLTALMSKMGEEKTTDPEFSWWEEELATVRVTETTGLAANTGSTALACSGGGVFSLVAGDVLLVEKTDQVAYDNEIVVVSSVTSDTAAVIKRAQAGTTVAAIAASTALTKIGNVFSEGSGAPGASSRNPTKLNNYTQIFKTIYDISETATRTNTRTGDPIQNDKKRKMFDHAIALEWAMFFGRKFETTGDNGKPLRFMGGLRSFLSSNVTVFTTTPTEDTFLNAITPCFNYTSGGGNERLLLAGNTALNTLNKLAKNATNSRIVMQEVVKVYGMDLQKWILPQGTVYIKTHPLFNNHARFQECMFILDPSALKYRYIRDTTFKDNIQGNDEDRKKGQWLTECSLEVRHERTMGYIGKFTSP